jgi:predicted exporter
MAMGALTTILGIAPMLLGPFFRSMTVVIMFGLAFETLLTLLVVPLFMLSFSNQSVQLQRRRKGIEEVSRCSDRTVL